MADKEGKVRTFALASDLDPQEEARQMAAYERAKTKAAARAAAKAEEEREERERLSQVDFAQLNAEDFAELSEAPRRRARESALLLLYAIQIGDCGWETACTLLDDLGVSGDNAEFARVLALRADEDSDRSDQLLSVYAREWDVERFSPVDRAVLRLAVSELLREPSNAAIIINEAIELGKKFGGEESGSFINGMLDNIYNKHIKAKGAGK